MKLFISKIIFFSMLIVVLLLAAIFAVPSAEMSASLLAMGPIKHAMLRDTPAPRIILVGGSNLSYGLNSQVVKDEFNLPVINMGLHAGLGLRFMLEEVRSVIQKGDIVILAPEFNQYEEKGFWGNREVLGMIFEVMPEMRKRISLQQWFHLLKYTPNYGARKIFNIAIRGFRPKIITPDIRDDYNSFGDCVEHWNKKNLPVEPRTPVKKVQLSRRCFDNLEVFVQAMREKGAQVGFMPPCFQASSYDNSALLIERVEKELHARDLPLLAPMQRYRMADHLCYDTPYHLNKKGVDIRSQMFVEDLAGALIEPTQ